LAAPARHGVACSTSTHEIARRSHDRVVERVPTTIGDFIEHFRRFWPKTRSALRVHSTRAIEIVTRITVR